MKSPNAPKRLRSGALLHSRELLPTEIFPLSLATPLVGEAATQLKFGLRQAQIIGRLTLGYAESKNATKLYIARSTGDRAQESHKTLAVIDLNYNYNDPSLEHMVPLLDWDPVVLGRDSRDLDMSRYVSSRHIELTSQAPVGNLILRNLAPTNGTTIEFAMPDPNQQQ